MGHWTRFQTADICRHCGTAVEALTPAYHGKSAYPFCESCATRIGFSVPADLPATSTPQHERPSFHFKQFDRGQMANQVREKILDYRSRRAGSDE